MPVLKDERGGIMSAIIKMMLVCCALMSVLVLSVVVHGCMPMVEVNIVQRSLVDVGDGTNDSYSKMGDEHNRTSSSQLKLLVPLQ